MKLLKILSALLVPSIIVSSFQFKYAFAENVSAWNGYSDTAWYTLEDVLHIKTSEELAGLSELVENGYTMEGKTIVLDNDIYLNDVSDYDSWNEKSNLKKWKPIGTSDEKSFNGTFDGGGNVVYGLYMSGDNEYSGLFGYCESSSYIVNLKIDKCYIDLKCSSASYVGGIAGISLGNVENCSACGNVENLSSNEHSVSDIRACTGGIVGYSYGTISNCESRCGIYSKAETSSALAKAYAGGISGYSTGKNTNCKNFGDISALASVSYTGGICGFSTSKVENSSNSGEISAECEKITASSSDSVRTYAGGISGSASVISNCVNNGMVSSFSKEECYLQTGGISGYSLGDVSDCVNNADVFVYDTQKSFIGGISGRFDGKPTSSGILRSFNYGNVKGGKYSGGIAGFSSGGLNCCANYGNIEDVLLDSYSGGIAGEFNNNSDSNSYINNSYNRGNISSCGNSGKIVGNNVYKLSLRNIYNTGKVINQSNASFLTVASQGEDSSVDSENVYHLKYNNLSDNLSDAKTSDEMKMQDFAKILGTSFLYMEGDYPSLSYEKARPSIDLNIGENYDLAKDYPGGTFETSDENVVKNENGVISAVSSGYAVITVKKSDGSFVYIRINVSDGKTAEPDTETSETQKTEPTTSATSKVSTTASSKISSKLTIIKATTTQTTSKTAATTATKRDDSNLGDVNNDKMIDSKDAVLILKKYAKYLVDGKMTGISISRADVNRDGKVDSKDAVIILKYYASKLAGVFNGSLADFVR